MLYASQIIPSPSAGEFVILSHPTAVSSHCLFFHSNSFKPHRVLTPDHLILSAAFVPQLFGGTKFVYLTSNGELRSDDIVADRAPIDSSDNLLPISSNFSNIFSEGKTKASAESGATLAFQEFPESALAVFQHATHVGPSVDRLLASMLDALLPRKLTSSNAMDVTLSDSPLGTDTNPSQAAAMVTDGDSVGSIDLSAWSQLGLFSFDDVAEAIAPATPSPAAHAPTTPSRSRRVLPS